MEVPSGIFASRYGYFRLMILGLTLSTLGAFLSGSTSDLIILTLARAVTGFGAPLFYAVSTTLIIDLFNTEQRGRAMGLFQGIEFLGSILGTALSGHLVTLLGFSSTFLLTGAVTAAATLLMAVAPRPKLQTSPGDTGSALFTVFAFKQVLMSRNVLIVSSAILGQAVMHSGILYTVFPLYAREKIGLNLQDIGLLMGLASAGSTLSMLIVGYISDRIGRKPVLFTGLAATGALVLLLSIPTSIAPLGALLFALGFSAGAIWIVLPVLVAEGLPLSSRGPAIGVYRKCMDLGSVFGPVLLSALQDRAGYIICFQLSAALVLANLIPASKAKEATTKSTQ